MNPCLAPVDSNCVSYAAILLMRFAAALISCTARTRQHRPERLLAADEVQMDVIDFLPAHAPRIEDQPKAVLGALLACQPRSQHHHLTEYAGVLISDIHQRGNMLLRNDQEVHGRE